MHEDGRARRRLVFGDLDVDVAQLVPDEGVKHIGGFAEIERVERARHPAAARDSRR